MIFVTPYYPGLTDYGAYAKTLQKQGQCDGHTLLILTQRQDEEGATAFKIQVEKLFADVVVEVIDAQPNAMVTANAFLKTAMNFFVAHKDPVSVKQELPMLYGDPTWKPTRIGWLDTIQGEFFASGMPKVLCRWKVDNVGDKISWGPVLFSREYAQDAPLVPHIPSNTHWRTYLRHEIGNVAVAAKSIGTGQESVLKPSYPSK